MPSLLFLVMLLFATGFQVPQYASNHIFESIQTEIAENKVMLYSKSYCGYSRRLKFLLRQYPLGGLIKTVELNLLPNGEEMMYYLKQLSGIKTVPQLFINGTLIGGYTDVQELEDQGIFEEMLEKAGIL